jgi:cell division protein FtsQ
VQQGVSPPGRTLDGMQADRADGDESPRFDGPRTSAWRPASGWGRAFLAIAALILLGGLGTAGYLLKTYLNRDSRFRIAGASNIQAKGLTEVSRAEMLPVFGEDIGRNIFFVPLAERRRQLEQMPWIEHATVMRLLPDQIRISVVERKPVAFVRQGSQVGLADANGVLLTMPAAMMSQHHYSFPVVSGINPHDPPEASKTRMAMYQRLLAELDANNQHLSEQISEIDLADPEDARVLLPEQGGDILAHFGEDHFLDRYQRYKSHIAEWRQQYPKLAAVDLRYDQHVVLEMAHGADAEKETTGAETAANAGDGKKAAPSVEVKAGTAKEPAEKHASRAKAPVSRSASSAKAKPAKPGPKVVQKSKAAAAKDRAAKDKKKRAAARSAALELNKHKKPHLTAAATQGQ